MSAESILHRILEALELAATKKPPRFMAGGVRVTPIPFPDCFRDLPKPNPFGLDSGTVQIIDIPCPGYVYNRATTGAGGMASTLQGYPGERDSNAAPTQTTYRGRGGILYLPSAGRWTIVGAIVGQQLSFLADPDGKAAHWVGMVHGGSHLWLNYADVVLAPVTDTQIIPTNINRKGLIIVNAGAAPARVTFDDSASSATNGIPLSPLGTAGDRIDADQCSPLIQVRAFSTAGTTLSMVEKH
jgi:hypothetical protein